MVMYHQAKFQSTPPARGATNTSVRFQTKTADFNPRPPRGERPVAQPLVLCPVRISIHAPREGSDTYWKDKYSVKWHFNPRPPRGERRKEWETLQTK